MPQTSLDGLRRLRGKNRGNRRTANRVDSREERFPVGGGEILAGILDGGVLLGVGRVEKEGKESGHSRDWDDMSETPRVTCGLLLENGGSHGEEERGEREWRGEEGVGGKKKRRGTKNRPVGENQLDFFALGRGG